MSDSENKTSSLSPRRLYTSKRVTFFYLTLTFPASFLYSSYVLLIDLSWNQCKLLIPPLFLLRQIYNGKAGNTVPTHSPNPTE